MSLKHNVDSGPLETNWTSLPPSSSLFHKVYHPLFEIDAFILELASKSRDNSTNSSTVVERVRIGLSGEGREIWGVKISKDDILSRSSGTRENVDREVSKAGRIDKKARRAKKAKNAKQEKKIKGREGGKTNGNKKRANMAGRGRKKTKGKKNKKMGFVITGAQHAREVHLSPGPNKFNERLTDSSYSQWVATSTALYLAHALTTPSNSSDSLSSLLDHFIFYIIPMPNPDGYDWTWESDRFWYKNRMRTGPNSRCVGVDMNRCVSSRIAPELAY